MTSMMVKRPFSISIEELVVQLNGNTEQGLGTDEARRRLEEYGLNQIPQQAPKKTWRIFMDQFLDPIIYILMAAAVLAFLFSDPLEGFAILIVIFITVAIGFFMELQAVRSLEALRKMGQAMVGVIRSGSQMRIRAAEVVPGDLIILEAGDMVPADARLVAVDSLTVKESALTGESVPIAKQIQALPKNTLISDRSNMIFRGTMVVAGRGKALVTSTGKFTQLGIIQQMGVDAHKQRAPLEKKLNQLSIWLIWLTLLFAGLIVVTGYFRGKDLFYMIETGVALAVAAIPEGLPIVATIALAKGMMRLSKKQVIIKKLEAVQTLGATDIICTDKTGTLTEDRMKVHHMQFEKIVMEDVYHNEVASYNALKNNPVFNKMILAAVLCNNTSTTGAYGKGDSIELALMHFAVHLGYDVTTIKKFYPEQLELPFDPRNKLMATAHKYQDKFWVFAKGAFESLAPYCNIIMDGEGEKPFVHNGDWRIKVDKMAAKGLRTLAFAYKEVSEQPTKETIVRELSFLGIIGFIDPAREDVKSTMAVYKKAGIKVVMVTGDHPGTARKIAEEVGLLQKDATTNLVMEGKDLQLAKGEFVGLGNGLLRARVFARVTPEQKLDLVTYYQRHNHIVGMIGDGINDVPALKKADIGIAMGIRGTEAAREVADVILKNDKFTAIEMAIRQGRVVFQNIRQFVVYLLSCNLAEILSVGVAALLNLPSPLLPLQILFLNLVTDVFPALALGLGKGEKDIMSQSPKNPKAPILDHRGWHLTILYGLCISFSVLGMVVYADIILQLPANTINNMAFYTLVMAQLLNVFNMPRLGESFFVNEVTTNIWVWGAIIVSLGITFGAYFIAPIAAALTLGTLTVVQLELSLLFALASLVLAQMLRLVFYRK